MANMINTNIASLNAQNNLNKSQGALTTSLQRLSSGLRINSAKDDSAGLAISERMTSQIKGNDQAARNANDAISMTQTAEGDLTTISDSLQRMRELAVQSSTGSNSASDRLSIDNEVQALSKEIDRVAQNSSFNGNKLLDGSFTSQNIQIGANATANDTIAIAIGSARTSSLGGVGATNSSNMAATTATTAALTAGDLTLNGFQVGASALGAAPGQSTASAFSAAAAINAISADSGVTATANSNIVSGTGPTAGAIADKAFSINGIDVGAVKSGTSAAGQGANVAAAINKIATQTGVTATADAGTGALTLTAADGRDIQIGMNNTAADATAATNNKAALVAQTGLAQGVVGTQTTTTTPASAVAAINNVNFTGVGAVGNDTVTVNGVTFTFVDSTTGIGESVVDASNVTITRDITNTALTGATAATALLAGITAAKASGAATESKLATVGATNGTSGSVTITDTTAGVSSTVISETSATAAVVATTPGTAAVGASTAGVVAANHGTVTLNSTSASGIVLGGANAGNAGFTAGTASNTVTSSVKSIASINVLTAANATSALSAIDGALATVNASKASLGVYQNRFASVVSNLQSTSENLTASRSRIQDTDFAKETASLTRGQILQQAGTAMLAQANSLPNGVMALLR